jgi:DNA-binding NtrC family response regulator
MTAARPRLCLVEDDEIMGESLCDRFDLDGFACDWHKTASSAMASLERTRYAAVISDVRLPDLTGDEMFARLNAVKMPLPPFIFITAFGAIDTAVRLMKQGAADYITKPFDLDALMEKIRLQAASMPAARTEAPGLGQSAAMRRIAAMLPRLASHASTVLITGESGVGKENVAVELHRGTGASSSDPFVAVNCGALTESLLEAELFGYEKGAFTGALRTKKGVFEQAHGGTLFLDEIGEMPLTMQVKLLRAIQNRSIVRVGGETPIPVKLRLVCATHRDLKQMVEQGTFREDLFYRINVIQLKVPPLRERREDILWFAALFLEQFAVQHGMKRKSIHPAAELALVDYPWPGNVRELKHAIERACILMPGNVIGAEALFEDGLPPADLAIAHADLSQYLQSCERRYITSALNRNGWRMGDTALALSISRKNLWEKIRKLEIQAQPNDGSANDSTERLLGSSD